MTRPNSLFVDRRLIGSLIFCIALSAYLLGGLLYAQWSIFADHVLRSYRVGHNTLSLADIPRNVMQTEVGHPGEFTRYRPTNYLMCATEGLLWGNDPLFLHMARVLSLILFLGFLAAALCRYFSFLIVIGLCAVLMTAAYWKHVLIGFGPNEICILVVAPFFLWAYTRILSAFYSPHISSMNGGLWLMCCLTAVLLAGIKENMTIVTLPLLWLGGVYWWRVGRLDLRLLLVALACIAIGFIIGAVVAGVRNAGADFYGNSVTLGHRLYTALLQMPKYPMPFMLAVLAGLGLIGFLRVSVSAVLPGWVQFAACARGLLWPQAGLVMLSLAHIFFYEGWPADSCYSFPLEFFVFLTGAMLLYLFINAVRVWYPSFYARAQVLSGLVLIVISVFIGYSVIRTHMQTFTLASREFT